MAWSSCSSAVVFRCRGEDGPNLDRLAPQASAGPGASAGAESSRGCGAGAAPLRAVSCGQLGVAGRVETAAGCGPAFGVMKWRDLGAGRPPARPRVQGCVLGDGASGAGRRGCHVATGLNGSPRWRRSQHVNGGRRRRGLAEGVFASPGSTRGGAGGVGQRRAKAAGPGSGGRASPAGAAATLETAAEV